MRSAESIQRTIYGVVQVTEAPFRGSLLVILTQTPSCEFIRTFRLKKTPSTSSHVMSLQALRNVDA